MVALIVVLVLLLWTAVHAVMIRRANTWMPPPRQRAGLTWVFVVKPGQIADMERSARTALSCVGSLGDDVRVVLCDDGSTDAMASALVRHAGKPLGVVRVDATDPVGSSIRILHGWAREHLSTADTNGLQNCVVVVVEPGHLVVPAALIGSQSLFAIPSVGLVRYGEKITNRAKGWLPSALHIESSTVDSVRVNMADRLGVVAIGNHSFALRLEAVTGIDQTCAFAAGARPEQLPMHLRSGGWKTRWSAEQAFERHASRRLRSEMSLSRPYHLGTPSESSWALRANPAQAGIVATGFGLLWSRFAGVLTLVWAAVIGLCLFGPLAGVGSLGLVAAGLGAFVVPAFVWATAHYLLVGDSSWGEAFEAAICLPIIAFSRSLHRPWSPRVGVALPPVVPCLGGSAVTRSEFDRKAILAQTVDSPAVSDSQMPDSQGMETSLREFLLNAQPALTRKARRALSGSNLASGPAMQTILASERAGVVDATPSRARRTSGGRFSDEGRSNSAMKGSVTSLQEVVGSASGPGRRSSASMMNAKRLRNAAPGENPPQDAVRASSGRRFA